MRTRIRKRVGVFAFGALAAYYGWALLHRGVFVYENHRREQVYSPGLIVIGGVLMLLAIVPDSFVAVMLKRRDNQGRVR